MAPADEAAPEGEEGTAQRDGLIEFAAAASHDLSTPLQLINGYAEMLAGAIDPRDPEAQAAMDGIRRAVDRMRALVDGLLGYARLGDELPAEPVDAAKVLSDTIRAMEPQIEAAEAEVEVADELPTVNAIPGQLHQLFQNLLSNAIKFRGAEPPHVRVACAKEPGVWHFTVADNGIGISKQEMVTVFDIFKRSRTVSDRPGSGIGLAVAKGVVERHGGQIWAESEPDSGTVIHFTLPIAHRRRSDPRAAGSS